MWTRLKRLDAHLGTPQRFEGLLCWGIVALLVVGILGLAGCCYWGMGADWDGDMTNQWDPRLMLIP